MSRQRPGLMVLPEGKRSAQARSGEAGPEASGMRKAGEGQSRQG